LEKGLEKGLETGKLDKARSTARKMLASGTLSHAQISEFSGLSLAEVRQLAEKMQK
jgi:hypothetical protein